MKYSYEATWWEKKRTWLFGRILNLMGHEPNMMPRWYMTAAYIILFPWTGLWATMYRRQTQVRFEPDSFSMMVHGVRIPIGVLHTIKHTSDEACIVEFRRSSLGFMEPRVISGKKIENYEVTRGMTAVQMMRSLSPELEMRALFEKGLEDLWWKVRDNVTCEQGSIWDNSLNLTFRIQVIVPKSQFITIKDELL